MSLFSRGILAALAVLFSVSASAADSIIKDGQFLNPIGIGANLTPWADWTNAGVSRQAAGPEIGGNYAILPKGADLFQRFAGPALGTYQLSFLIQNPMAWSAKVIIDIQEPLGFGWHMMDQVIHLPSQSGWLRQNYLVHFTRSEGTPSEFYFSNSYNFPDPSRGFQNTINPDGTLIWVADVSLARVPEPETWLLMIIGFLSIGLILRNRHSNRKVDAIYNMT